MALLRTPHTGSGNGNGSLLLKVIAGAIAIAIRIIPWIKPRVRKDARSPTDRRADIHALPGGADEPRTEPGNGRRVWIRRAADRRREIERQAAERERWPDQSSDS